MHELPASSFDGRHMSMTRPKARTFILGCWTILLSASVLHARGQGARDGLPDTEASLRQAIAKGYSCLAHALYGEVEREVERLAKAVERLVEEPSAETLLRARDAWVAGRRVYGMTEVFRFYEGPIDSARDGVENFVNSWPVDEAYIDYVVGGTGPGLIGDPAVLPFINTTSLLLLNERGGETNISVGWHAIEFLLWGQDLYAKSPGRRPHTDYSSAHTKTAVRRGQYLVAATSLLLTHVRQLVAAWAPDEKNYRREFEADSEHAIRRMLTGMVVLSGFEMSGERLAVAYETRDQEQEHSCFSDTTVDDFIANQRGIAAVYRGDDVRGMPFGLRSLVVKCHPAYVDALDRRIRTATAAVEAVPAPFDQAILAPDDTSARKAILAAMEALEGQSEALSALGSLWKFEVPLRPGPR
jgi:putative iron-regulated protein